MNQQDRDEFLQIVMAFAEFKSKTLSAPTLELYWNAMRDWPIEEFRAAANHLITTCEFMPQPKDFFDLRKASRPTAGEVWAKAIAHAGSAIQCGQVTRGTPIGDPLIDAAVQAIGGYGEIAMCEIGKLGFLERRFAEHYGTIQDANETREAVPQVTHESIKQLSDSKRMQ